MIEYDGYGGNRTTGPSADLRNLLRLRLCRCNYQLNWTVISRPKRF